MFESRFKRDMRRSQHHFHVWPHGSTSRGNAARLAKVRERQHVYDGWSLSPYVAEWQRDYAHMVTAARKQHRPIAPFGSYVKRVRVKPLRMS